MYLQPFPSPEHYIDVPVDNPNICDANIDLAYEDNMFNTPVGNIDNFMSLGYLGEYSASLDTYCMYLVDTPRKSCGIICLISLLIFPWCLVY